MVRVGILFLFSDRRFKYEYFLSFLYHPSATFVFEYAPETRLIEDTDTNCKSLRAEQRKLFYHWESRRKMVLLFCLKSSEA